MSEYHQLANMMREQGAAATNDRAEPRSATISSYDPANMAVKVLIQPEGTESNWMQLPAVAIGNGFGFAVGPNIGDQVMVAFPHGDFESGKIVGRYFDANNQAIPVPSGEAWLLQKSGSLIKFLNSGDVILVAAGNASYTAKAHQFVGPVMMSETLTVAEDITDNTGTGNTDTVRGMREIYDGHTHEIEGVSTGNATITSTIPNQQE